MNRSPEMSLWSIAASAFVPPTLFSIGQGAIAPVVVITAGQLGASPATAAMVVGLAGIGQVVADIPAGVLATRFGDRAAMLGAAILTSLALALCMWGPNLAVFAAAMFATGMGTAVWLLARQAYVTQVVPFHMRARAMSTMGGVYRIGLFIGPFLGSLVVHLTSLAGAYAVFLVCCVLAVAVLFSAKDLREDVPLPTASSTFALARAQAPVLRTLGVGVILVSAVRGARQVVLPLWGEHLGLTPAAIAVIFGISGAADMLLFYPAGKMMDRFGRSAAAIPSMTVVAISLALLPLTHSAFTLAAVGIVMGLGNGIGSGLIMTLGADFAPPGNQARFLGVWRLLGDFGNGVGPLALAGLTAAASLGFAITAFGGVGLAAAAVMGYWIPKKTPAHQ
ncbi:MFS transporter [Nakamurella antarctica]|uniref:MFS transporter n=1 Tax=Nakamurella antarctica TaxID=1902245 RepID=A0A3G8ZIU3_9ACTN|nr:MFS transporter [Nakamurella antarctica]AZI57130.1 MFS transporter [Nakamurella antarctica]